MERFYASLSDVYGYTIYVVINFKFIVQQKNMLTEFSSYHRRRAQKKRDICARMREAKARKAREREVPAYPLDRSKDYRVIHIEDCCCGNVRDEIFLLEPTKKDGRIDQFNVWHNAVYVGLMGWERARVLVGRAFPVLRAPR